MGVSVCCLLKINRGFGMSANAKKEKGPVVRFFKKVVKSVKRIVPQTIFKFVVTHIQPHADEIVCMMLLASQWGKELFPGIFPDGFDIKKVKFIGRNKVRHFKANAHYLYVGCGGGEFDEHSHPNGRWEAACTLVARYLGLIDNPDRPDCPWWKKILRDVRREDREGGAIPGEIAYIIKCLYKSHGGTPKGDAEVIRWAMMAYQAEINHLKEKWESLKKAISNPEVRMGVWYEEIKKMGPMTTKVAKRYLEDQGVSSEDREWFSRLARETMEFEKTRREEARENFLAEAKVYPFQLRDGRCVKLYTVESDNPEMSFVVWGFNGDIVVIRDKNSGHTAIMTKRDLGVSLAPVHHQLLKKETNSEAEWVLPAHETKVLNGSPRFPDVVPSSLSLNDVAHVITSTLGSPVGEKKGVSVSYAFTEFERRFGSIEEALGLVKKG